MTCIILSWVMQEDPKAIWFMYLMLLLYRNCFDIIGFSVVVVALSEAMHDMVVKILWGYFVHLFYNFIFCYIELKIFFEYWNEIIPKKKSSTDKG